METLEQNAAWLRTKIKRCLHADKFIQAEVYEYELELIEEQITNKNENYESIENHKSRGSGKDRHTERY